MIIVSVDCEFTGPNVVENDLLSVGMAAFSKTGEIVSTFYYVIKHRVPWEELKWDAGTKKWWDGQLDAREYLTNSADRHPPGYVAGRLKAWLEDLKKRDEIVFLASPVSADWPWINDLLWRYTGGNPFGHRAICLRSMVCGATGMPPNTPRGNWPGPPAVQPAIPHHALYDAIAQGQEYFDRFGPLRKT